MYIKTRMEHFKIQSSLQQPNVKNYLSGGLPEHGPLFEPDRNKSQVAVKDYLGHLSKDIAGPVLMNI